MEGEVQELQNDMQSINESMIQNTERLKRLEQKVDENMFERVAQNKARVKSLEDKHTKDLDKYEEELKWVRSKVLVGIGVAIGLSAITTVLSVATFVI